MFTVPVFVALAILGGVPLATVEPTPEPSPSSTVQPSPAPDPSPAPEPAPAPTPEGVVQRDALLIGSALVGVFGVGFLVAVKI